MPRVYMAMPNAIILYRFSEMTQVSVGEQFVAIGPGIQTKSGPGFAWLRCRDESVFQVPLHSPALGGFPFPRRPIALPLQPAPRPNPAGSQRVVVGRPQRPPPVYAPKYASTPQVVPEIVGQPDQHGRPSPTGPPTVVCVRDREALKQSPVRQVASRRAG